MKSEVALRYRPATRDDWPPVHALLATNNLPLDGAEALLANFLLVECDDTVVACIGLERHGDAALLRSCAVNERYRGRGIGRELTRQMIELAKARGIVQLVLLTTTAERYFSQLGFATIDRGSVPDELKTTDEFRTACPASATVMRLMLRPA